MDYNPKYLVFVDGDVNHNKFYRMTPHGDTWTAEWGRVGNEGQKMDYSKAVFEKKYNEKVKKGYVDQTELVKDLIVEKKAKGDKGGDREIEDAAIREIVKRLQRFAKASVEENYTVSSDKVTQAMVDEAQKILDGLVTVKTVVDFNHELIKLFRTIPRKMKTVQENLATTKKDFSEIISREQDTLDVMKGQVVQRVTETDGEDDEKVKDDRKTILERLGLEISEPTKDEVQAVKDHIGSTLRPKVKAVWKVVNRKTQAKFDKFCKDNDIKKKKLVWHGSRNENWWSILQTGLVLRPTNAVITGKMFGYGIYGATSAMKSYGYTSGRGSCWARGSSSTAIMAVFDMAYGKPYDVYSFDSKYYNFDWKHLQSACPGAYCLHAHAGTMLRNDEIIVYKEDQMTIKYLVEIQD